MRSKIALVAALCLALVLPASALGDVGSGTTAKFSSRAVEDTAVAYYLSPDGTQCLVLGLDQRWVYGQGKPYHSTGLGVGVSDAACGPSPTTGSPTSWEFRIFPLEAAYVVTPSFTVSGLTVTADIAWVVTNGPYPITSHYPWSVWVGKGTDAHMTGTVMVNGVPWVARNGNVNSGTEWFY
jgi:hypothetical protein